MASTPPAGPRTKDRSRFSSTRRPAPARLRRIAAALLAAGLLLVDPPPATAETLRILSSYSVAETGLIHALAEEFRRARPDIELQIRTTGALTVLDRAREGEADLAITHHPQGEELFIAEGYGLRRTIFMYNELVILGPPDDPLGLAREDDLLAALRRIAKNKTPFLVAGEHSGTANRLDRLWATAGVEPGWAGYRRTQAGMAATLRQAARAGAHTFADLGTYLANRKALAGGIVPLYRDHVLLRNYYAAIVADQRRLPGANQRAAEEFLEYLVSDPGQGLIRRFGEERFGAPVFTAAAHLDEGLTARRIQAELEGERRRAAQLALLAFLLTVAGWLLWRVRRLEQTRASEERFQLAIAGANDGIWDWDAARDEAFLSARLCEILDLPPAAGAVKAPRRVLAECIHAADRTRVLAAIEGYLCAAGPDQPLDLEFRTARTGLPVRRTQTGGAPTWVRMRGKALRDAAGVARRASGSLTDITEYKNQAAAIEYQALHDALTGLPNRLLLQARLEQALAVAREQGGSAALIIMDLDRFKRINDTLGHEVGDRLLQQVCARLRRIAREADTVARLGGDEFALLLPDADEPAARRAAQEIQLALNDLFELGHHSFYVGGSLGIAVFPQHGADAQTLIQHADVAMYAAKRANCGCAVYDARQDPHSLTRLTLERDLREALERNALDIHFQPKVDLRTRVVTGVEALLRWNHPQRGAIPPCDLIPIAEETGLIRPLTLWVLNAALTQGAEWRRRGISLDIAVNLSVWNLQDPTFLDQVKGVLAALDAPAQGLEFEITESAMMSDLERAAAVLHGLSAMGIRLAVDDFGTGFSSLAYLKKLPVDSLKIDKSFIQGMVQNEDDAIIVRSTIDLAHNLGLKVVAEGIETEEVLETLIDMGCDRAQGNYFSRPRPHSSITRLLRGPQPRLPRTPQASGAEA